MKKQFSGLFGKKASTPRGEGGSTPRAESSVPGTPAVESAVPGPRAPMAARQWPYRNTDESDSTLSRGRCTPCPARVNHAAPPPVPPRRSISPCAPPPHSRLSHLEMTSLKEYRDQVQSGRLRAGSILKWSKCVPRDTNPGLLGHISSRLRAARCRPELPSTRDSTPRWPQATRGDLQGAGLGDRDPALGSARGGCR